MLTIYYNKARKKTLNHLFASGLFGRNGLSPLHIQSDTLVSETKAAQFHKKFFFSQLPKGLNVEPEYSIDIICLVGAFISFVS